MENNNNFDNNFSGNNCLDYLIDTHCHLNIMTKDSDRKLTKHELDEIKAIIQQAKSNNVLKIVNIGTNLIESINSIEIAQAYAEVYCAIGIHPNDLNSDWKQDLAHLETYLLSKEKYKIVGIGECGLDKHYPGYNLTRQKDGFKAQIELALRHNLALVVHTRDAAQETLDILYEFKKDNIRGVIHCFSEDTDFAQEVINLGFMLGIGGVVTYPKNNAIRDAVLFAGINNIVLETDAPYLPPQVMRGQKNSPAQILTIAHYLSKLLNLDYKIVEDNTTANAKKLFKF